MSVDPDQNPFAKHVRIKWRLPCYNIGRYVENIDFVSHKIMKYTFNFVFETPSNIYLRLNILYIFSINNELANITWFRLFQ